MTDTTWNFTNDQNKSTSLPLASREDTHAFFKKHGFHVALIGYSKHGKTFVAATLASFFDSVEILDTDGGMITANKQLKNVSSVRYQPCWGLLELEQKIEESKAACIMIDSISAAIDQSKLDSRRSKKTTKAGNDPGAMEHARVANAAFIEASEVIREACRYHGKVIISLCGIEEDWKGSGEDRKYVGFRPGISARSGIKYPHVCDMYAGQVREPTPIKDPKTGFMTWDYSKMRYITILKPTEIWPFVGLRGDASFTEKIPTQIENFNLSNFLRAYVHDLNN